MSEHLGENMTQDIDQIFGPSARGDFQPGEQIHFREKGQIWHGEVLHCSGPQRTVGGRHLALSYEVDCDDGFPHIVLASQVFQEVN